MLLDAELRECYRAATYMPDGRLKRGRKVKHDTATRRWIDTVGFPAIAMGKRLPEADLAMLRLSPRSSLSGNNLIAHDAWSQLHGRDPRSKKQTVDEQAGQQTLLRWARTNMPDALAPGKVRRGRVASWTLTSVCGLGTHRCSWHLQVRRAVAEQRAHCRRKMYRPAPT